MKERKDGRKEVSKVVLKRGGEKRRRQLVGDVEGRRGKCGSFGRV